MPKTDQKVKVTDDGLEFHVAKLSEAKRSTIQTAGIFEDESSLQPLRSVNGCDEKRESCALGSRGDENDPVLAAGIFVQDGGRSDEDRGCGPICSLVCLLDDLAYGNLRLYRKKPFYDPEVLSALRYIQAFKLLFARWTSPHSLAYRDSRCGDLIFLASAEF